MRSTFQSRRCGSGQRGRFRRRSGRGGRGNGCGPARQRMRCNFRRRHRCRLHHRAQVLADEREEPLVEVARLDRLARYLHHRVAVRADRQRKRAEHAEPHAGRRIALLERVTALYGVRVDDARIRVVARHADHVKIHGDVRIAGRLEILRRVDRVGPRHGREVTLAQQRAAGGLARVAIARVEVVRKRARARIEHLLLKLGRRGTRAGREGGKGCQRADARAAADRSKRIPHS